MRFKIGDSYKYQKQRLHIRGFVDKQVIYRIWAKRRRQWEYFAIPEWLCDRAVVDGWWKKA